MIYIYNNDIGIFYMLLVYSLKYYQFSYDNQCDFKIKKHLIDNKQLIAPKII